MSPIKMTRNALKSGRPRKKSTQKRKPVKQRKIPKALLGVPVCHYGAKFHDFMNGDETIRIMVQPPVASESSAAPLHDTTPQDTLYLDPCFPPVIFAHRGAEPSYAPNPLQHDPSNSQSADMTKNLNPCQSYGVLYADNVNDQSCDFIPLSSSTGGLSMEYWDSDDWYYQLEQWLDSNPHPIPQSFPSLSCVSNTSATFPGDSYNNMSVDAEVTGMAPGSSYLTLANDGSTLHFPNYDANNNPHNWYM